MIKVGNFGNLAENLTMYNLLIPMQKDRILHSQACLCSFFIFFVFLLQNIDCRYSLEPPRLCEAVVMSTHNLCFGAIIR